ncbi:hypothetical protein [Candidatus Palauibacter sp.]|uniref:hypothetical protein n=1 Tax=Candidatus Palauibacter sp. TaxID=3101350 RepID=UPI003B0293D5
MSYEERLRHRDLLGRATDLRRRLERRDADSPMRREEGLELVAILEATLAEISPERWDRVMEAVASEAARRAGAAPTPIFD